jgi:hypothetical protein
MTRSEVLSALNAGEGRFNLTAGMAIRGQIRRAALMYGVDYYEEKGWFESLFVMRGPAKKIINLKNAIEAAFGDE